MIRHNQPQVTTSDRQAVDAVLATGWIAQGPEVMGLESEFDAYFGGGASCVVSSGTAALYLALKGLGVQEGTRVALPTYSCSALLNAILMAGGIPLLTDVRSNDFNLDPASLQRLAGDRAPRVTIAVHTFGARAPIEQLKPLSETVIEDCCQALGGNLDGRPLGSAGDAAVFSFYATKIISCGQGGLVRDQAGIVATAARDFREFDGRADFAPRFNLQLTDFQAALARSQFQRLKWIAERRREIARCYLRVLPPAIRTQAGLQDPGRMVQRFVLVLPDEATRDALRAHLEKAGIQTIVPIERFELLHRYLGQDPREFPVAERLVDTTLSLPLYPALDDDQVGTVCDALARAPW